MKKTIEEVKRLYNTDSFIDVANYAKANFKDAGGIVLARSLEHVSPEIFTQEYAGLTFLSSGVVVNNEGGASTSILKLKIATLGEFRESGTNTDGTGKITLSGEDDSIPVMTLSAESEWSEVELAQSALQNINLPSRYFEGHAEVYNRKIDDIGYLGQVRTDGTQKTLGLLNTTAFSSEAAAGTAVALSGADLYGEIAELITDQWAGVFNVPTYMADRVVMPDTVYTQCLTKFLNTAGTDMTVLRALQMNFPTVTFGLTTKARSVGGSSKTVAFSSNRKAMQFRLPVPLKVSSVHQRGFKYYVDSYFGVAGLDVIESGAGRIMTGL